MNESWLLDSTESDFANRFCDFHCFATLVLIGKQTLALRQEAIEYYRESRIVKQSSYNSKVIWYVSPIPKQEGIIIKCSGR